MSTFARGSAVSEITKSEYGKIAEIHKKTTSSITKAQTAALEMAVVLRLRCTLF